MHRKKIYRSMQKQGMGIRQSVAASPFFDEEDVHSFRTRVKKLRAFYRWLGKGDRLLSPSFKEMYKVSGQLRDIQVLLEKQPPHSAFTAWLKDNAARLRQLWDDTYDPSLIRRLRRALRRPSLKKPTPDRLRAFINKSTSHIESIVYLPAPADDDLHDIRKELKNMYLVLIWGKKNDCADKDQPDPGELKELGEQCGRFNDKRVALTLLSAYVQQEQDPEDKLTAEELRRQWEEERTADKAKLLQALRTFIDTR